MIACIFLVGHKRAARYKVSFIKNVIAARLGCDRPVRLRAEARAQQPHMRADNIERCTGLWSGVLLSRASGLGGQPIRLERAGADHRAREAAFGCPVRARPTIAARHRHAMRGVVAATVSGNKRRAYQCRPRTANNFPPHYPSVGTFTPMAASLFASDRAAPRTQYVPPTDRRGVSRGFCDILSSVSC